MSPKIKPPEILSVMVGTAGHVDHGKTALVKLLTGCDTDRLKEEKERGLSIDLGIAPCLLPGNRMVGIIDVPGHLDFIRNMVAGAASMDILMLIVAADDGIMPQTREHLQIIQLLRAPQLMVVVTKTDLVDEEMLELVIDEVQEFADSAGYPDASIIPASNITGEGVPEVRKVLDSLVEKVQHQTDPRAFRMYIERVFSVKGYGTVATGIPMSGQIKNGGRVVLLPGETTSRIRAIQNYKHESDHTGPNLCAAINLVDISPEDLHRGMTLVAPEGHYRATRFVAAEVHNDGSQYVIPQNAQIRFHAGTANVSGRISFLTGESLKPGQKGLAKIRLTEPVAMAAGDKFILRWLSPSVTLGGGTVLSNLPQRIKGSSDNARERFKLAAAAAESGDDFLTELLAGPRVILSREELRHLTRLRSGQDEKLQDKLSGKELIDLGDGAFLVAGRLPELAEKSKKRLKRYHQFKPNSWGLDRVEFSNLFKLRPGNFAKFVEILSENQDFRVQHKRLSLASFQPAISKTQMDHKDKLFKYLETARTNPPARGNILKDLGINEADLKLASKILAEEGLITPIGSHFMLSSAFDGCREKLLELFEKQKAIEINDFREVTGASRNNAVALLEKFDALGITRRTDAGRVLGVQS